MTAALALPVDDFAFRMIPDASSFADDYWSNPAAVSRLAGDTQTLLLKNPRSLAFQNTPSNSRLLELLAE